MKYKISRLIQNKFIKGSIIFTISSALVSVLNYLFNFIIARLSSLSFYGEYMTAMSYIMIFSIPQTAIKTLFIKKIGEIEKKVRLNYIKALEKSITKTVSIHGGKLVLVSLVLMYGLLLFSNLNKPSIIFIMIMVGISLSSTLYSSALQASKRFFMSGLVTSIGSIAKIIGGILVLILLPSLPMLYLVLICAGLISLSIARHVVLKQYKKRSTKLPQINTSITKYIQKKSTIITTLATLGLIGMLNIDLMLVKKFFSPELAGLYAGLSLLSKIILYLSTPISMVSFTFFTGADSKSNRKKILITTFIIHLISGLGMVLIYSLFSQQIIALMLGNKFISISKYISIAAVYGLVYSLLYLFAQYYISRESNLALATLVSLAIQVVGIYLHHQTPMQIMTVNTLSSSLVLLIMIIKFARDNQQELISTFTHQKAILWQSINHKRLQ